MSLSSDVRDAFAKPNGMQNFGENHPVVMALAAVGGFVAALILVSRYMYLLI